MWIGVHSNLKKWNKNIVKDVLEWSHNSILFVHIVQPRKLQFHQQPTLRISNGNIKRITYEAEICDIAQKYVLQWFMHLNFKVRLTNKLWENTWISQTTFWLYSPLFTIQLASWSHSLCFLPYIDILYSAICESNRQADKLASI
jgi:hypothetical protein